MEPKLATAFCNRCFIPSRPNPAHHPDGQAQHILPGYVEALDPYEPDLVPSLFLAGGITGCPDWQREMVSLLAGEAVTLLNPRRASFPIDDPTAAPKQIEWEHLHLRKADGILFWFPCEALCPIALYELGAWSMTSKPLFVGVHPNYQRRQDVEVQTALVRPDVAVRRSLPDVAVAVKAWLTSLHTQGRAD
jgi:hypothetical protein